MQVSSFYSEMRFDWSFLLAWKVTYVRLSTINNSARAICPFIIHEIYPLITVCYCTYIIIIVYTPNIIIDM